MGRGSGWPGLRCVWGDSCEGHGALRPSVRPWPLRVCCHLMKMTSPRPGPPPLLRPLLNSRCTMAQCRDLENHHHEKLLEIAINTLEKVVKGELDEDLPEDVRAVSGTGVRACGGGGGLLGAGPGRAHPALWLQ